MTCVAATCQFDILKQTKKKNNEGRTPKLLPTKGCSVRIEGPAYDVGQRIYEEEHCRTRKEERRKEAFGTGLAEIGVYRSLFFGAPGERPLLTCFAYWPSGEANIFTPHLGRTTYQGGGSVVKPVIEDLDPDPHMALVHRKLVPRKLFLVTPTPAQVLPRAIHLSEKNSVFLNCMSRGAFTTQKTCKISLLPQPRHTPRTIQVSTPGFRWMAASASSSLPKRRESGDYMLKILKITRFKYQAPVCKRPTPA